MRGIVVAICLAVLIAGCGDGELTLNEYAVQMEELVTTMNREIDALDAGQASMITTVDGIQDYFEQKLASRHEFLESYQAIAPPEDAAEMHAVALDIVTKLIEAEEALALRAERIESPAEWSDLWIGEEAQAFATVDEEAVAICQTAQAQMDSTTDREVFGDVPWIPSELQEVVLVFFGCTKADRGTDS
jgi:hypothetical protein